MTREDMYELIRKGDLPEIRAAVTAWFAACAGQYRRGVLMEQEYIRALFSRIPGSSRQDSAWN